MSNANLIDQLVDEIVEAINDASPSLEKLKKLLQDAKDLMAGAYFKQQPIELHDLLRDAMRDLETKINGLRSREPDDKKRTTQEPPPPSRDAEPAHDPEAEKAMNEAEIDFFAGRYLDAIKKYEKVLKIEPNWERALQHKKQAEEYLRTGHIPTEALPPDAAILFGKAQSAARVMNFKRARELFEEAKEILEAQGISRFADGQKFEDELNKAEEAQGTYNKGLEVFNQGNIDEAINKVQMAADLAGIPMYKEKVAELRDVRETINQVRQKLYARPLTPELVLQASAALSELQARYNDNPLLGHLLTQRGIAVSQLVEQLFEKADRYLYEATISTSISVSINLLEQAEDTMRVLEYLGEDDIEVKRRLSREQKEWKEIKTNLETAQQVKLQIENAFARHQSDKALEGYRQLQSLYPSDGEVIVLGQKLKYQQQRFEIIEPILEEKGNAIPGRGGLLSKSDILMEKLAELLLEDPTNRDLLLHYEWVRLQHSLSKREELFRDDRMANARALHQQSGFWFNASIVTAVLLLLLALVLIWLSFDRQNPWTAASSLISLVPVLATQLVYRQALLANERADKLFERIHTDNQKDLEMERQLFDHVRSRLFGEAESLLPPEHEPINSKIDKETQS